jgi:hypothetical protein
MKTNFKFLILLLVLSYSVKSQDFSKFSISGYVDTYFSYDSDKNGNTLRQFSAIAPYREEFRINIAQVSLKYNDEKVRGVITAQYGDIPSVNWPSSQQYIQEAYAGFSPAKNLWIDAGFFLTHIGAEGVLPKSNFLTTMSLPVYFEPFFQSGIRVGYDFSPKFYGCFHLLNGYNVFMDNNKNKSAGITLGVKPSSKVEIVYNNLFGNEIATEPGELRIYNNLIIKLYFVKKLDVTISGDAAFQENSKLDDSTAYGTVYSGLASLRYRFTPKFSASIRGEFYMDNDGILSGVMTDKAGKQTGLKAFGITAGFEVRPVSMAYFRMEARYLSADKDQEVFIVDGKPKNTRFEAISNVGIEF